MSGTSSPWDKREAEKSGREDRKSVYIDEEKTRELQNLDSSRNANLEKMEQLGEYNLVKVLPYKMDNQNQTEFEGYFTTMSEIQGKTPEEMERKLGLPDGSLKSGASVYMLREVPKKDEFEVRGYSSMPDGLRLSEDLTETPEGYPRGQMAWQAQLSQKRQATLVANVEPNAKFDGGMPGPHYDKHYKNTLGKEQVVRRHFDDPDYKGPKLQKDLGIKKGKTR